MLIWCPMGPFEALLGHLSEAGTAMYAAIGVWFNLKP